MAVEDEEEGVVGGEEGEEALLEKRVTVERDWRFCCCCILVVAVVDGARSNGTVGGAKA